MAEAYTNIKTFNIVLLHGLKKVGTVSFLRKLFFAKHKPTKLRDAEIFSLGHMPINRL